MVNQSTVLNKDNKQVGIQGRNAFISMPLFDKICMSVGITTEIVGLAATGSATSIASKDGAFWTNLGETLKAVKITPDALMVGGIALMIAGGAIIVNHSNRITKRIMNGNSE
jgi:hypothetical protein